MWGTAGLEAVPGTAVQSRGEFCPWMPSFQLSVVVPVCHFSLQPQEVVFPFYKRELIPT